MTIKQIEQLFATNADKEYYADCFWSAVSAYGRDFGIKSLPKEAKNAKTAYEKAEIYCKLCDLANLRVITCRFAVKICKILFDNNRALINSFARNYAVCSL